MLNAQDNLHCQIQALSFLLLMDKDSATPSISKAPIYTEDAVAEFERSCEPVKEEDASFLVKEMCSLFYRCWTGGQGCEEDGSIETSNLYTLYEMVLIIIRVLCKAGHDNLASIFLNEIESKIRGCADCTALVLGKWAIEINSTMRAEEESGQALRECARTLRSLSPDLGDNEAHSVLEGCGLVVWAVERRRSKGLSGPVLLAWFSFLEEQQDRIIKILNKVSAVLYASVMI